MTPNWLVRTIFVLCLCLFFSVTALAAGKWVEDSNTGCKIWLIMPDVVSDLLVSWSRPIVECKAEGNGILT